MSDSHTLLAVDVAVKQDRCPQFSQPPDGSLTTHHSPLTGDLARLEQQHIVILNDSAFVRHRPSAGDNAFESRSSPTN